MHTCASFVGLYQPGFPQHPKVLGYSSLRHPQAWCYCPHTQGFLPEQTQYPKARRAGQRPKKCGKFLWMRAIH